MRASVGEEGQVPKVANSGREGSDPPDLDVIFRDEYRSLLSFSTFVTGDTFAGEELAQEAFVRLAARLRRGPAIADAHSYLRRTAVNAWRNVLRRTRIEARIRDGSRPEIRAVTGRGTSDYWLWTVLSQLPTRQRACLILRFFDDCTEAQTAEVLGISVNSVKTHSRRAFATIRRLREYGTNES